MKRLALLVWLLSLSGPSLAQQVGTDIVVMDPLSTGYLMKLTGGLVLVVAIIFAFAWLVKRLKLTQHCDNGVLKVVAGIPLGTRERIVVLQVGEEQVLLGLSPGRIQKLHTLSQPIEQTSTQLADSPFAKKLSKILNPKSSQ